MHNDSYASCDDIGYPLVGVTVRLDDCNEEGIGEIAVKGPNVMLGYYKNPKETAKVMCDGWFYTGDLAVRLENGAYKIVGRKKSMIVAQNGKKIFPEELEYHIEKSPFVAESMVYEGEDENGTKIICAAVYPDREAIKAELEKRGEEYSEDAVVNEIQDVIHSVNLHFPHYKTVRRTIVRREEFIKTTTHKIKRNETENKNGGDDSEK